MREARIARIRAARGNHFADSAGSLRVADVVWRGSTRFHPLRRGQERPFMGSLHRVPDGCGNGSRRSRGDLEGGFRFGDGHVYLPFLDSHDDVPVLVVAEYLGAGSLETV